MSYAIVMFEPSAPFAPRGLYCIGAGVSSPEGLYYTRSLADARQAADEAANHHWRSCGYAVVDIGTRRPPVFNLPAYLALRPISPVYVPSLCADLARHYGWACDGLPAAPAPSFSVLLPDRFALVEPAPRPALPLDPEGPIELEDGTPCDIQHGRSDSTSVYLRPTRPSGRWTGGYLWVNRTTGRVCGLHGYPTARNASSAPVVAETPLPVPSASPASPPAPPSTRYEVRSGLVGTDRNAWGTVSEFDSGREAAAWVGANKASYAANGKALCVVKVEPSACAVDWRAREAMRFHDGAYTPLPGTWADRIALSYPDHFPHVASSDKRKVAFTESESSGERDKQKVLTASAYVERFFGSSSSDSFWYSDDRARFVSDMLGSSFAALMSPLGDAEAMVKIYRETATNGAGSVSGCMSHPVNQYATGGIHPVTVYAEGGELTVAFLRGYGPDEQSNDDEGEGQSRYSVNPDATWDGKGPILARCLVWIKDGQPKGYGRVYGDCEPARTLRTVLEAAGYPQNNCTGARIAKVSDGDDNWIMPYLDIGDGSVTDRGDYWTAGGDEWEAQRTDGLLSESSRATCEHCDERCNEDDTRTVLVGRYESETWCEDCRDNSAFQCHHLGVDVSDDYAATYRPSGSRYTENVADWLLGDVIEGADVDGVWCEDAAICVDCSDGIAPDDVNTWDGRDTRNDYHGEGEALCSSCHSEREALAEALADEQSPELPLASAA